MFFDCKIMKRYLLLIFIFLPTVAFAQTPAEKMIQTISQAGAQMQTLECDFVQVKHLSMLSEDMVSYGKMYYSQPDKLRWEYTRPYEYTFILSGNQVLLNNSNRTDVIDVDKNKMFKEITRLMSSCIVGICLSDEKDFKTTIQDEGKEWVATLIPLKRDLKQMWTRLVIHFDVQNKSVTTVKMYETSGDCTEIELKNVRQNHPVKDSVFQLD